ncbi:MAG: hypothetical protein LBH45_02555 [Campylobacteraceae bacterium]|jgi:hypothetical protein|nr:hypothetical protein [Campylobacteraceae bacterium]
MGKIVKLFAATLACGLLLVGCGGGGGGDNSGPGGDNNQNTLSLALVESSFLAFDYYTDNLGYVESYKIYEASPDEVADFKSLLLQQDYNQQEEDFLTNGDVGDNMGAEVAFMSDTILLMLLNNDAFDEPAMAKVVQDDIFNGVFDGIPGNVTRVEIIKFYDTQISDRFDEYTLQLSQSSGFNCNKGPSTDDKYVCTKDGGNMVYYWEELGDFVYAYGVEYK